MSKLLTKNASQDNLNKGNQVAITGFVRKRSNSGTLNADLKNLYKHASRAVSVNAVVQSTHESEQEDKENDIPTKPHNIQIHEVRRVTME